MSDAPANEPTNPPAEGQSVLNRFIGKAQYDDRIDLDTEISSTEAVGLLMRCLTLIGTVRWWFVGKFVGQLGGVVVGLFLPWIAKIVIDNVLLQEPIGSSENPYPPFMNPILQLLEGMTPLEIMFTISMGYLAGLILVGTRAGGISIGLFGSPLTGQDETAAAENKISSGWSASGGIWGLLEYWANVRLSQGIANNLRTRLFARLTRLPMSTLTEKRTGDSIYRVLYDAASIPLACIDMTVVLFFAVLAALVNMALIRYSYGTTAPELVWIAWSVVPLVFVLTFPASNLMRRINQSKRSAGSATTNAMEETMGNIDAVQSLGGMQTEADKFSRRSLESYFRERGGDGRRRAAVCGCGYRGAVHRRLGHYHHHGRHYRRGHDCRGLRRPVRHFHGHRRRRNRDRCLLAEPAE